MGIDYLVENVWLALGIWVALYASDYYLTVMGARRYRDGAGRHIAFETSYELTPYFEKDINALRRFSPRFFLALALTVALQALIWYLAVRVIFLSWLFELVMGGTILVELAIHVRHLRNLALFRFVAKSQGVEGKISYAKWLSLNVSAVEMASFSILMLIILLLTGRLFFAGGALTCLMTGIKHSRMSAAEYHRLKQKKEDEGKTR
ncbi:MAG: hypothetical protein ABIJ56_13515 [Pseudomonadota bacterium]